MSHERGELTVVVAVAVSAVVGWAYLVSMLADKLAYPTII